MIPAAALLVLKGLPWLKIGAGVAIVAGLYIGHGQIKQSGYEVAKAECIEATKAAQNKADARLADQREKANSAVAEALLTADEYKIKLQGRQNELRKTTANLANCRLAVDTIRLLNDARADAISKD